MKMLHITENKMLRVLDNSSIKDKRSRKDMLEKLDLPSKNKLAAQIKLQEAWKSMNVSRPGDNPRSLVVGWAH